MTKIILTASVAALIMMLTCDSSALASPLGVTQPAVQAQDGR